MMYDSFSSLIINVILVKNLKKVYSMTVLKSQKGTIDIAYRQMAYIVFRAL